MDLTAHGPDRNQKSLDFWPCYLCCLRDPGSVHHRPARAMLASLLFEPCSSSPGHLRPCAPCCVGHAESQPYARSDTAPVVCALRVFVVAGVPVPQGAGFERRRRGQGRDTVAAAVGVGPPRPRAPARPAPSLVSPTHPPPLLLLSRGLRKQPEEGSSDETAVATMPRSEIAVAW